MKQLAQRKIKNTRLPAYKRKAIQVGAFRRGESIL